MSKMRKIIEELEEHIVTRDKKKYVVHSKSDSDPEWKDYADIGNWYSDRLHDALHKVMDRVDGLIIIHGGSTVSHWSAFDLTNEEANNMYDKCVSVIDSAKKRLGVSRGVEKRTTWGKVTTYGEVHGAAAIVVDMITVGRDGGAALSVGFHPWADMNTRMICREAGVNARPSSSVLAKDFDYNG